MKIGFIGQGFVGKSYADDFETRGYDVVRYSMEEPYIQNKNKIAECDIVLIAVPTPTTPDGFDDSIIRSVMGLIGAGKTAVIKSTIPPGTTRSIQSENPNITVMHSPEFLTEKTAGRDAAHPDRNIIGVCEDIDDVNEKADTLMSVLPIADYNLVCRVEDAEMIKYAGNCWFYVKVVYMNILYDMATKLGLNFDTIVDAMAADPRIGSTHLNPVHQGGRGAGGHCFIKDFAAFKEMHDKLLPEDVFGSDVLLTNEDKNKELLLGSRKDLDLLEGVYGKII